MVDEGRTSPCTVFHRQLLLNDGGNDSNSPPVFSFSSQCLSYPCSLGQKRLWREKMKMVVATNLFQDISNSQMYLSVLVSL